ncbi:ACR3 family arsenite efflux transporter [Paraglaciecola aquimarina]|uniref:ACR3 family arsenite efflux transporter n=1 Tax=Paraglaciecola algarum TaxID=3050085 RepID=A0ABS9D8R6_9ALTE|nr:ACR3 family arsenite efflux transporter [Paraglaciecola sp. G1-23]MCF2948382.1 ACR3 family arsenite efflux transporter [Paraglaciecola sp. G1-23]
MGLFERYLSVWVGLSIIAGVVLGSVIPGAFEVVAGLEYAHVNIVVAVLIWLMVYPMMIQIDFSSIKDVGKKPKGLALTLVINWLVKPFTMAALGWLFFKGFFADWVDPQSANEYIAGMILLGVAPCTAMVFVWSQMTKGDPNYTLVQVSINDIIMIFAFAPLTALLLGVSDIHVPWDTLLLSVVLYVVLPLVAGALTRSALDNKQRDKKKSESNETKSTNDHQAVDNFVAKLKPWSIIGLLATVVLLFGFQAQSILSQPETIVLIAIPLIIQTYGIFAIAYFFAKRMKLPHNVAAPACMIGTSNFFELAVAVAISLFGLHSGAALATVVGVLVEVPVMLSLVYFANRTRHWFD